MVWYERYLELPKKIVPRRQNKTFPRNTNKRFNKLNEG